MTHFLYSHLHARAFMLRTLAVTVSCGLIVASILTTREPLGAQGAPASRTAFISAVDKKGDPVVGLGPEAFQLKENGKQREVVSAAPATEPLDVVIVVDNSGSVEDKIRFMRDALVNFVAAMGKMDARMAIITIDDRTTPFVDYTKDQKQLADGIGKLFPLPQTRMMLLDGLIDVSANLNRRTAPRAVIVPVFTDAGEGSNETAVNTVAALTASGAQLHAVALGRFAYSAAQATIERGLMLEEAPKATGGQHIAVFTPPGLDAALQKLAAQLAAQYKVVYNSPEPVNPRKPFKLEVKSSQKDVTMRGNLQRTQAALAK